jgi:hypothetical protein
MFKLREDVSYLRSKYPWPKGVQSGLQYGPQATSGKICLDMPYMEHHRKTPKAAMWRVNSGSRPISVKYPDRDYSSFEGVVDTHKHIYAPYKVLPWTGMDSLEKLVEIHTLENWESRTNLRYFFWGLEHAYRSGCLPPNRDDI